MNYLKNTNQRTSPRKIIDIPIIFRNHGEMLSGRTIDLSETGLSIESDILFEAGTDVDLYWLDRNSDYIGFHSKVIRHIEDELESNSTGLEFLNLSDNNKYNLRRILNLPFDANITDYNAFPYTLNLSQSNHRVVSDENLIAILLTQMHKERLPVYVRQNMSNKLLTFVLTSIDTISAHSNFRIRNLNIDQNLNFSTYQELILFFNFQSSFYVLKTEIISIEGENICLKTPGSILQLWRRSHPKSRLDLKNENVDASLITSHDKEYIVNINDIGYHGLSLNIPSRDILREIGYSPVRMCLKIQDEMDISFEARLKYIDEKLTDTENIYNCGFEITSIDPQKSERLGNFIFKRNYPHIVPFNEKYIDEVWDLFFKSGYMIPEKMEYVRKVKTEIEDTWGRVYGENSKIGKMFLFMDNDEVYGTLAAAVDYENTWVIHQLAGVRHQQYSMALYLHESLILLMIEIAKNSNYNYVKAYFRNDNKWAKSFHFGFQEFSTHNPQLLHYSFLDLYEYDIEQYNQPLPLKNKYTIEFLTSIDDTSLIIDYLRKILPNIVIIAESLNVSELYLPETNHKYKEIGLIRERKIILSKEDNKIISFAILENGSTGINLGGLFDTFQIYTIEKSHENLFEINKALMDAVIQYYKSSGKNKALCLSSEENEQILTETGFKKTLEYIILYIDKSYAAQFVSYMNFLYTWFKKKI